MLDVREEQARTQADQDVRRGSYWHRAPSEDRQEATEVTVYRKDLSPTEVRELLDYDPETGEFTWRPRLGGTRSDAAFNAGGWPGRSAGSFNGDGYRHIKIGHAHYCGHRLAWLLMTGGWPAEEIDHINCDKSDNRFCNLRLANRKENTINTRLKSNNKTGFKGVCFKPRQGYHAQIMHHKKAHHLGFYPTAEQAHQAYCKAAKEMHGEFARTE